MNNQNGKLSKWALGILAGLTMAWIIAVSGGLIRAEIREARLCNVEKMIEKMDSSVNDLAKIKERLDQLVKRLEKEHNKHGQNRIDDGQ